MVKPTSPTGSTNRAPATGERTALRGYRWQYDHIAALVYDALLSDSLVSLRLSDPSVGRVDDLVMELRGEIHGYQFKSAESPGTITLNDIVKLQRTRSGGDAPSLIASLADGWTTLSQDGAEAYVHLVTEARPSINDHAHTKQPRPTPDHFTAFVAQVLRPISSGDLRLDQVADEWKPAISKIASASAIPDDRVDAFLRHLRLDCDTRSPLPDDESVRRRDLITLSDALYRLVSEASDVVVLDRDAVLSLVGWGHRPRLRSTHEFPVDLDAYSPLTAAIDRLLQLLDLHDSGYLAVVGPPGAGKSTLLSQALSGRRDRVLKYFAYVPGTSAAQTRLSAGNFLHDLVLMLGHDGLPRAERHLVSDDLAVLRQQLAGQLDAAAGEFETTGRRTILVIDGLDHVERDDPTGGLLHELPRPSELPNGVIVITGSRTLSPLGPFARQQVDEREGLIDLQQHRLSTAATIEICERLSSIARFERSLHERIAALSDGHPLALAYLLNRLRDVEINEVNQALDAAPPYSGDIGGEYRAVWDTIADSFELLELLAVCARLRVGFTPAWLRSWASAETVSLFAQRLRYLFRSHHDGLHFFHDSFRQFAVDHTNDADGQDGAGSRDAEHHNRVADLCAASEDRLIKAEELHHRASSGDEAAVLRLARPTAFREQLETFRAPALIRSDISEALAIAADSGDIVAMLRLMLSQSELFERESVLESVDIPAALFEAGLVDEAVAYVAGDPQRAPLAHAYGLASAAAAAGEPTARPLFDRVDRGFDDDRIRTAGQQDAAAIAWAGAAPWFRSLGMIIVAIEATRIPDRGRDRPHDRQNRLHRFHSMMIALIDALVAIGDDDRLAELDAALAESQWCADMQDDEQICRRHGAVISDLRLRVWLNRDNSADDEHEEIVTLQGLLRDSPMFPATVLRAAEELAELNDDEAAARLLDRLPYERALTVSSLTHGRESDVVIDRFRYWRLKHHLAQRAGGDVTSTLVSSQPAASSPAGDDVTPNAALHQETEAIELARQIDSVVRELARIDAASMSPAPVETHEVWSTLVRSIAIFDGVTTGFNATLHGLVQQRWPMLEVAVEVAAHYRGTLLDQLAALLGQRIAASETDWFAERCVALSRAFRTFGFATEWHADSLDRLERSATQEDIVSRLGTLIQVIHCRQSDGDPDGPRRVAFTLIPVALGVGYRKDYQFDEWVDWLTSALAEDGGEALLDDAAWLTRLVVAADPITEGAPGLAAVGIPPALVPVSVSAAVRSFEFLVSSGTIRHTTGLAALVEALVAELSPDGAQSLDLAADLMTEVIAPVSTLAYPELAAAVLAAEARIRPGAPSEVVHDLSSRLDVNALPTLRAKWRLGLGITSADTDDDDDESDYHALLLSSGERIRRREVAPRATTADEIANLRSQESADSTFSWMRFFTDHATKSEDLPTLGTLFDDNTRSGGEALAALAEVAVSRDEMPLAAQFARRAMLLTSPESWASQYSAGRRRAAAVLVRAEGETGRLHAARDLAAQIADSRYLASMLATQLADVVRALDPTIPARQTWPAIRGHLDGIAQSVVLPGDNPFEDRGRQWWCSSPSRPDQDETTGRDLVDAADGLAELAVRHLSHPAWLVKDGAMRTCASALARGDRAVARALSDLARYRTVDDDLLETIGRCVASARAPNDRRDLDLHALDERLAASRNQAIRELSSQPITTSRILPPRYELQLPPPMPHLGEDSAAIDPRVETYSELAEHAGIDSDTVLNVAASYAAEQIAFHPSTKLARSSMSEAGIKHLSPSRRVLGWRAAFGRVLADLHDAGRLKGWPPRLQRRCRQFDLDLVMLRPESRPLTVPSPPEGGHDQTVERWISEIETRLDRYADRNAGAVLIGGEIRLSVLNWGHLEEEFRCFTFVDDLGDESVPLELIGHRLRELAEPTTPHQPSRGEPIVVTNSAMRLHQRASDWWSFRPSFAAGLGWAPDEAKPGRWLRADGEIAVDRIWWVDGWWGNGDRMFDDTSSEGKIVVLTDAGLSDVVDQVGPLMRCLLLERSGRESQTSTPRATAERSLRLS